MKLILASGSPRRKELLETLGVSFDVLVSDVDESFESGVSAEDVVQELAKRKAKASSELLDVNEHAFVLGADTVCVFDDEIIGKARDKSHAKEILQKTRGNMQEMITGVSLLRGVEFLDTFSVVTEIYLKYLTDRDIDEYLETDEYMGVAGAYNYQKSGQFFTERVVGSETNVIGLPLDEVKLLLQKYKLL